MRISSGFVAGKVIAFFIGPSGIALIGQFSNFISIVLTFSNGAINNGVIKYTSEYKEDENKLKRLFSTSFKISFCCSVLVGIILIGFADYFALLIFNDTSNRMIIKVFGGTVLLYSLNTLLISILNGRGEIKKYTIVNTVGVVVGLILTIILVYLYKIQGALYALILGQSIVFFFTLLLIVRADWFEWGYFTSKFDIKFARKLGGYSLMALTSALTIPISQIVLRNLIINKLGVDSAGYWQAMMRISDGYLMLIITSLSTYYLPKLSGLKSDSELRKEIFTTFKIIMPIITIGCIVIYFLRFFIINLLYTAEFMAMERLFLFQLLGDILKIASWLICYVMVAKAMTKMFIYTEIFFNLTYIGLGYICISYFNLEGISLAFFFNYLLCLVVMLFYFRKLLYKKDE